MKATRACRLCGAQLISINRQLRSEARKILASLENEASVAQLRERQLLASLDKIKVSSAQAGGEEVQLRALEREATSQRQLLETYLARFRESASRSQASSAPPDARIISRAIVPTEAYFPKKTPDHDCRHVCNILARCHLGPVGRIV